MFFYDFNNLENFIYNCVDGNIDEENNFITDTISIYTSKKNNLLNIITNLISIVDKLESSKRDIFLNTILLLKNSFEDIESICHQLENLKSNLTTISDLCIDKEINFDEIKANLIEYNKQHVILSNLILEYEKTSSTVIDSTIELSLSSTTNNIKSEIKNTKVKYNDDSTEKDEDISDNNILTISEKDQLAYLPYKSYDVKKIYSNSNGKYSSVKDVIQDLYIVPLKKFKNSSTSRFREAYNLMRKKEKSSVTSAIDLGLELMFNFALNPIVIAACRDLDELDVYLDCLEEKELQNFNCFEIKYQVAPQIVKQRYSF